MHTIVVVPEDPGSKHPVLDKMVARSFSSRAEADAYCAGYLDAHDYDDDVFLFFIYDEQGALVHSTKLES